MRFLVGLNGQTGEFEVHREGCADTTRKTRGAMTRFGRLGGDVNDWDRVKAENGDDAAAEALRAEFSDEEEHPAQDGFPGGSFGAAGFTARVFPCAGGPNAR